MSCAVPFYLVLLLRSCLSQFFVPGDGPLRYEWFNVDLRFFWDGRHQCVAPDGALVDAMRVVDDKWGCWVG